MKKINKKNINKNFVGKAVVFTAIATILLTAGLVIVTIGNPLAGEPNISNVDANPDPQKTGGYVNITCDVTDSDGVDEVYLNITDPNNNVQNFSITGNNTGNTYYCNKTYSTVGRYSYFIWANDTSGNSDTSPVRTFSIVNWKATLTFNETGNISDTVTFGEVDDASDGKDVYDVPKPPQPGAPYTYAYFDAGLSSPYNKLWGDYRQYGDASEVWNLTVDWENQSGSGTTNVTIGWDTDKINDSGYDSVILYDKLNGKIINMKTEGTLLFNQSATFRYDREFQIIGDWVLSDNTTSNPTTGDPITFGVNLTHKKPVTSVKANYRWKQGGSWNSWNKDISMSNGSYNDWATSGLSAPSDATDVEYYFTIITDGHSIYIYDGSLALTDDESIAEGSPFTKTVADNDPPTVSNVAVDTDPVYSGDLTQQVTVDFSEPMDTLVDPTITFSDGTWTAGGGSWTDSDTYVETFTLTSSTEATLVDITVDSADDDTGNTMTAAHTANDLFDIDNVAPTVSNVAVDTDPVYSGDLTQQVTVDFSEPMDTLVDPTITFSDGTWTAGGGSWTDSDTYVETFTLTSSTEATLVDITVDSADDDTGNTMTAAHTANDLFDIDNVAPTVSNVAVDTDPVYSGDLTQQVTVDFSEPMDTLVDPTITFSDGTWTAGGGSWTDSDTYVETFTLTSSTEATLVDITVDGADDDTGNTMTVAHTANDLFDIDNVAPTVSNVAVDTDPVYSGDLTQQVTVDFSEPMDTLVDPTITFSDGTWTAGGGSWTDSDTYVETFTLTSSTEATLVDITVDSADDDTGNTMTAAHTANDLFDIDNVAPTVSNVAVDTDPVYSGDLTQQVTVDFSEPMDTLVDPTITFSDGTWTAGGGSWTDSDTYVETFTLTSSTEATLVDITVDSADDDTGNTMTAAHTANDLFDIDNVAPTVSNVAVDTDPVYSGDLTQQVTVDFSEPMDTLVDPTITFSDGTWTAGGGSWTDSDTYVETFTLTSSTEATLVDITVDGADDDTGNTMTVAHTANDLFDIDNVAPTITNIDADPSVTPIGGYVNISCDVTDTNGIDTVIINITGPTGFSTVNTTMLGSYYYNDTYNIPGIYNYFIWANDTSGNSQTSGTKRFTIISPNIISLHSNWNMISLPFNESINKTDIVVSYGGNNYSWNDAVSNTLVLDFIYGWNRTGQKYETNDTLEPGYGYWLWAYHDCDLLVSSNITGDGYITDLKQSWNMMGLPYNTSLAKEYLIIRNNSVDYTWQQAIDNNIILGFIYGWNSNSQNYILSDDFDPGYGYWMYTYYNCTLKWDIGRGELPASTFNLDSRFGITWDVTLNFNEPGGKSDYVVFGEALDASDGKDSYDVPNPPPSMEPYIDAYFNTSFTSPHNKLWEEYKAYPDDSKIWSFRVNWNSGEDEPTNVTISWDRDEVNDSEYNSVVLYDYTNSIAVSDMMLNNSYTYNYPDDSTHRFQIICTADNEPPEIINDSPSSGETGDMFTFNATITDNMADAGSLIVKVNWSHSSFSSNDTMVHVGGDYFEKIITLDESISDLTYHFYAEDNVKNSNYTSEFSATVIDDEYPNPISDDTTANPTTGENITFGLTVIDNIDISYVYANYRWKQEGSWSIWTKDVLMSEGGSDDWITGTISTPLNATDAEYYFKVNDGTNTVYVYNGSLAVTEDESTAEASPLSRTVSDNDDPTISADSGDVGVGTGDGVTLWVTGTDNIGVISADVSIDGGGAQSMSWNATSSQWEYVYIAPGDDAGDHTYMVTIYDAEGLFDTSSSHDITVTDNDDPTISADSGDVGVGTGDGVTLWVTGTDNIGVISADVSIDGGGAQSMSWNATSSQWEYVYIAPGDDAGDHTYMVTIYDAEGLFDTSSSHDITVTDNDDPTISADSGDVGVGTGDGVTLWVTGTDNIGVISADVSIDGGGAQSMSWNATSSQWEYVYIAPGDDAGDHTYMVTIYDAEGLFDTSSSHDITVTDDDLPEIFDVQATPSSTPQGGNINITCSVTDNIDVDTVNVNITGPVGFDPVNTTMDEGSYYYNESYNISGEYSFFIWANDTCGNENMSDVYHFEITQLSDTIPPEITEVTVTPSDPLDTEPGFGWENFTCTVIDNVAVDEVKLILTYPDTPLGTTEHLMTNIPSTDTYYYNTTFTQAGNYSYHIWATDHGLNNATSSPEQFALPMNEDVDLNGQVYFDDLVAIVMMYGDTGANGWVREDVDNNGEVYFDDLIAVVMKYGEWWK